MKSRKIGMEVKKRNGKKKGNGRRKSKKDVA